MIIEKHPLPDDPTPPDAPPSYDTLAQPLSSTRGSPSFPLPEKPASSVSNAPQLAVSPTRPQNYTRPGSSSSKGKAKGPTNWFNFSASRNTREVRQTVLGLLRGLVRHHTSTSESLGILESCAEACASYDLCLSSLLQEKFIEEHTPLYWAIIKRPPEIPHSEDDATVPDFLTTLLSFSDPLTLATKSEMRLACLLTSDQALFQRLRLSPEFSPLSGTDEILLGASMPPDEIIVEDVPGDEGAFVVKFEVVQFQQRMRISKRISLEFIARGRMWCLAFSIATGTDWRSGRKPGSWCLSLSLLEHSPPTWIDSRLLIDEPRPPSPSLIDDQPPPSLSTFVRGQNPKLKPKPTICLRLKSGITQLVAPLESVTSPKSGHGDNQNEVVVSLDDSLMGASLQYDGSSYIASDGSLKARLEARLAKPEAECIIC